MEKPAKQKEIEEIIGRTMPPGEYTSTELMELSAEVKTCRPLRDAPGAVPLIGKDRIDPRLLKPEYLRTIYNSPGVGTKVAAFGLDLRKLSIILGLDGTLINGIVVSGGQNTQGRMQVIRCHTSFGDASFLIEERPGATDFLTILSEVADLYLCAAAEVHYVDAVLKTFNWMRFFKSVVCGAKTKSISLLFPELANVSHMTIIFDEQMCCWVEASDRNRLFPSLRFVPLLRGYLSSQQYDVPLARTLLTYYFSPTHSISETWTQAETTFLASPHRDQFYMFEEALLKTAEKMFCYQYQREAYATFLKIAHRKARKKYEGMRKIYIHLGARDKCSTLEHLLTRMGGVCVKNIEDADTVCVDQSTPEAFGNKKVVQATQVFSDFFLASTRADSSDGI